MAAKLQRKVTAVGVFRPLFLGENKKIEKGFINWKKE